MTLLKSLALTALLTLTAPVYAMNCYYGTHIDDEDLYNSAGKQLTSVGAIIRQDRANIYAGIGEHDGYDWDKCGLENTNKRIQLERIINKAKISPATQRAIKAGGGVPVQIEITKGVAKVRVVN